MDFRLASRSFRQETPVNHWKKSENIPVGILLPCFIIFRWFPAGSSDFFASFRPVPVEFRLFPAAGIIDLGIDSMKKRLDRIENKTDIIYEMALERRVIHALRSLGMTAIEGLSSEFYHYHEYQMPLISLAHQLKKHYYDRWICYNQYVDISLCPQTIEINLMGKFVHLVALKERC